MTTTRKIKRPALREEIRTILVDRLAGIAPGTRLRDQEIARELEVSRTPVREALASLADDGLIEAVPNRGFRTPMLRREEPAEIYPLIWTLESFGLRQVLETTNPRLSELRRANERLARESSPRRRLELDAAWHDLLLEECDNERLRVILSNLKLQVRPYEIEFLRDAGRTALSIEDHETIATALERGDHERAIAALQENWSFTLRTIMAWLPAEEST